MTLVCHQRTQPRTYGLACKLPPDKVPISSIFGVVFLSCLSPFANHLIVQTPLFKCIGLLPPFRSFTMHPSELHLMPCLCESRHSQQDLLRRCHCTRESSCESVLSGAFACSDAFMSYQLTTCCSEHHSSPALGTLSDWNVSEQCGNTQHAAPESIVPSVSSMHSIVLKCRRDSRLCWCFAHILSQHWATSHDAWVLPQLHDVLHDCSNCSNFSTYRSYRHGAYHEIQDFPGDVRIPRGDHAIVFSMLERQSQVVSLQSLHLQVPVNTPTVHSHSLSISRCLKMPGQGFAELILHTNPRLLSKYWANWLNWLCEMNTLRSMRVIAEVNRNVSTFVFQVSSVQSTGCSGKPDVRFPRSWAASHLRSYSTFLEVCRRTFHTIFLHHPGREKTNVPSEIFLRILWPSESSKNIHWNCLYLLTNRCHGTSTWTWSDLRTLLIGFRVLSFSSESRGAVPLWCAVGKYSTRTHMAFRRFQKILDDAWSPGNIQVVLSTFAWLQGMDASFQDQARNLSKRVLLLLTAWLLCHVAK